jgi:predicted PurR-regulated permease PerM
VRSSENAAEAVPRWLRVAAAWSWRFLLLAAAIAVTARIIVELLLVVLPVILALFATTVLVPPAQALRARGVPNAVAAASVIGIVLAAFAALIALLGPPVLAELDRLALQVDQGVVAVAAWLTDGPLGLSDSDLERGLEELRSNAGRVFSGVLSGAALVASAVVVLLMTVVLTFFFVKDGERMWSWLVAHLPAPQQRRVRAIGAGAWRTLGAYLRGVSVVALFDAVFIGIALALIGVPFVLPLAVLTFVGAFVPIVGAVAAGSAAALVALMSDGIEGALLVVAAVVAVQQIESQVLSPVVLGRVLELHPVPILLAVTAGGLLYGVIGAFLAAPLLAVAVSAVRAGGR